MRALLGAERLELARVPEPTMPPVCLSHRPGRDDTALNLAKAPLMTTVSGNSENVPDVSRSSRSDGTFLCGGVIKA